jgi:predicted transposase/invertase (TIGR01784 family)
MRKGKELVRFDWAMKRLLRDKANFVVLEGFLSVLLNEAIKIRQILPGDSNKATEDDKFNHVDILVENSKGELVIIEVQNSKELDYFHRILFGSSKAIVEYIQKGDPYAKVKKIISITIAYFDLGQGLDYVYRGTTIFKGIHRGDILTLSAEQVDLYGKSAVEEIYPEYWIIKAGKFDEDRVNDKLDEWIYFLKTGEVEDSFTAQGISEAKEKLDEMKLSPQDRLDYESYLKRLRNLASQRHTEMAEFMFSLKKEQAKLKAEIVIELWKNGVPSEVIVKSTKLSVEEVNEIIAAAKIE